MSRDQRINRNIERWIAQLERDGLDSTYPTSELGGLFMIISSGFGKRNVKRHGEDTPPPTKDHKAQDATVLTPVHFSKFPQAKAQVDEILKNYPGLKDDFAAQMQRYPTPQDLHHIPVKSKVAGVVLYVGEWNAASGETVMIGGVDGKIYTYAHLAEDSFKVKEGDTVRRGQDVAILGRTGTTNGGKCVHVVERQFRFPPREGEKPDFDRWSFLRREGTRVSPAEFREAMDGLRERLGDKPNWLESMKRIEGKFMHRPHAKEGDVIRPALEQDVRPELAKPKPKAKAPDAAKPPASKERSWGEWADSLNSALCTVSFGWVGSCQASASPPPPRPSAPRQR